MVEHNLAKVGVASSSLVSRSKFKNGDLFEVAVLVCGRFTVARFVSAAQRILPVIGVVLGFRFA